MSVGNKPKEGNKGSNHSYQSKNLQLLSQISGIVAGGATEATLQLVLSAIQDGQDFEAKIVVDDNGNGTTYLEVRIWNSDTQTWEAPLYYLPGSNTGVPAGSLTAPIIYINNGAVLAQIYTELLAQGITLDDIETNTDDVATQTTLAALLAAFNAEDFSTETTLLLVKTVLDAIDTSTGTLTGGIGTDNAAHGTSQKGSRVLGTDGINDQQIKVDTDGNVSVNILTSALPTGAATEATLLLAKGVLDSIKIDTGLMVTDLAAIEALLITIDTVLDSIKVDTGNIATDTAAMVIDLAAIEVLLTGIDTVLDNIKLDTANLALGTSGDTTSVAASATVVTLKASNTSRKSLKIVNDGTKILYVREGSGATTSLYTWKLEQDEMAIINDYNGIVTGIWDVANGSAKVTETT